MALEGSVGYRSCSTGPDGEEEEEKKRSEDE